MVSMGRVLKAKSKPAATKAKTVTVRDPLGPKECFRAPDGSTICSETFINAPDDRNSGNCATVTVGGRGNCATVTVGGRPYKVCLLKNGKSWQVRCTHEAVSTSDSTTNGGHGIDLRGQMHS